MRQTYAAEEHANSGEAVADTGAMVVIDTMIEVVGATRKNTKVIANEGYVGVAHV